MAKKYSFGKINKKTIVYFVVIFAVIGVALLFKILAAGPIASFEAENATLTSPAVVCSDTAASGGKKIQFGGTCTGGTSGGPTSLTPPIRAAFYYPWFP